MRLNLGAADRGMPGYLSVDIAEPADVIADLSKRWPWEDSTVDDVVANDIFEHLPDIRHTLNELWRVLKPGCRAEIEVPTTRGVGAFCDPTHVSYWCAGTFEYFEKGNYARERFRNSYGITADFKIVGDIQQTVYHNRYNEEVWKLKVILEAVK